MTKEEKTIEKLLHRPTSLKYNEIENLFLNYKFKVEQRKWSHKKISLKQDEEKYVIVPLHKNDCKDVYKIQLKNFTC